MRRTWLTGLLTGVIAGAAVLALSQGLHAQSGAPATGRIACVNVVNVFNEFQRQKDLTEELTAFQDKVNAEDAQRKQKIDAEQASVDRLSIDDPTRVERMRSLLAMQIDYKNWRDLKKADMTREIALWFTRIYQEILKATEEIARKSGYDMVLYRGAFEPLSMDPEVIRDQIRSNHMLYAADSVDLTQTVLDKLNADYRAQPRVKMLYSPD
jgi:Skp family chaperone for outer membrane proteins